MTQLEHHLSDWDAFLKALRNTAYTQLVVVVDANVAALHAEKFAALPPHTVLEIPPGESHKTLATAERLWNRLHEHAVDRSALGLVIGGGMALDLGTFVLATWKRGLRTWTLPTTLLAMVDAAWGGKTGVNFQGAKNLLGSFSPPEATFIWPGFLATLPQAELRSGFAECLKHALLAGPTHWERLTACSVDAQPWATVIAASIAVKRGIVAQDPTEKGLRKVLNLGHTLGHALESASHLTDSPLRHGEAVAHGLLAALQLSVQFAGLAPEAAANCSAAIRSYAFPPIPAGVTPASLRAFLAQDKKNAGAELRFVLLKALGNAVWDVPVPLEAALGEIKKQV